MYNCASPNTSASNTPCAGQRLRIMTRLSRSRICASITRLHSGQMLRVNSQNISARSVLVRALSVMVIILALLCLCCSTPQHHRQKAHYCNQHPEQQHGGEGYTERSQSALRNLWSCEGEKYNPTDID